jgi:hypothetical protein
MPRAARICPAGAIALIPAGQSMTWRFSMAEHKEIEYATATGNDYAEHENSYRFFLQLVKWHVIVIPLILLMLAYFFVW